MNQPPSSLPRVIGPVTATAIVVGTIIGSGVFVKPQIIAQNVPYSGVALTLWVIAGLFVLLGALAYAEVASVLPRAGGNYVFLREGYGRLWGFLWGWVEFWIIRTGSLAALGTVFIDAFADLVGGKNTAGEPVIGFWERRGLTLVLIVALAWVNIRGVRWGGGLQVVVTAVKILSLLFLLVLPWTFFLRSDPAPVTFENLAPTWPERWDGLSLAAIASAFLGIQWAYHGWMNIAPVAGEIDRPQRNIPLALLGGVGIVVFLYVGANVAYYLTMPGDAMTKTGDTPVAVAACVKLLGMVGLLVGALAIMGSTFGSLNGNLLVGPRLLYAMGEDGLAPSWLHAVHVKYRTPAVAIAVMTAWTCLLILVVSALLWSGVVAVKKPFDTLTDFAMFGAIIFETLAVLAIFVLRRTHADVERPYRCPGYPFVPAVYVLLPALVLVNMFFNQQQEAAAGVAIIVAGVVVYYALGLQRPPARPEVSP